MSLYQRLAGHARFQPDKPALELAATEGAATLTFQQLQEQVDRYCAWFSATRLKQGDRLAILALNHPDWFALLFAASRCGVVLVPLNWRLSLEELLYVIDDSEPLLLLHDAEFASTVDGIIRSKGQVASREAPESCSEMTLECRWLQATSVDQPVDDKSNMYSERSLADPLLIVYTSGTTGRPKGAVLSEQALLCSALMSQHMFDLSPADRALNVLPLFHVGGLNIQPIPTLLFGGTVVLHPRFDPAQAVAALEQDSITLINSVPTLLQAMIAQPAWDSARFASLRAISIGSTDVPIALIQQVHAKGIPLLQVYGATETGPVAIYQRIEQSGVEGSIGRAGLLCDIRLTDEQGVDVAAGDSGEIWVRGGNILSHYRNNPAANKESLQDGWFRTGDVAHCDDQGNYWFDDRLKHVVISGGENIYPAELERVIRLIPGVREVSVVGKAHERWGEVPIAVVAATPEVTEEAILMACQTLARFKQPKGVVFVEELPRNALGKVVVADVRELLLEH